MVLLMGFVGDCSASGGLRKECSCDEWEKYEDKNERFKFWRTKGLKLIPKDD